MTAHNQRFGVSANRGALRGRSRRGLKIFDADVVRKKSGGFTATISFRAEPIGGTLSVDAPSSDEAVSQVWAQLYDIVDDPELGALVKAAINPHATAIPNGFVDWSDGRSQGADGIKAQTVALDENNALLMGEGVGDHALAAMRRALASATAIEPTHEMAFIITAIQRQLQNYVVHGKLMAGTVAEKVSHICSMLVQARQARKATDTPEAMWNLIQNIVARSNLHVRQQDDSPLSVAKAEAVAIFLRAALGPLERAAIAAWLDPFATQPQRIAALNAVGEGYALCECMTHLQVQQPGDVALWHEAWLEHLGRTQRLNVDSEAKKLAAYRLQLHGLWQPRQADMRRAVRLARQDLADYLNMRTPT